MNTNPIKPKKNPIVALLGAPVVAIISVIAFFTLSVLVLHLCGIYIDKRLASTIYGIIASGVSLTAIGLFFLIIISGVVLILACNVPKLPLLLKSRYLPLNHHDLEALNYTNYENIEGFISFLISQCSFEPNNCIRQYPLQITARFFVRRCGTNS